MKVRSYKTDEIIYNETTVVVILEGIVHLKSHAENILPPKLLAKLGQGDILGYSKADKGISSKVESWAVVKSPTEVAYFDIKDFDVIHSFDNILVRLESAQTQQQRANGEHPKNAQFL